MKNNGKGGMRTVGGNYSLICPKCGKAAFRREPRADGATYLHFTKKGSVRHVVEEVSQ